MNPLKKIIDAVLPTSPQKVDDKTLQFSATGSDIYVPTGFDGEELYVNLLQQYEKAMKSGEEKTALNFYNIASRILSVSDFTRNVYENAANSTASMAYWFPFVHTAVKTHNLNFSIPRTKILRMDNSLAQYTRLDLMAGRAGFGDKEANDISVESFDKIIYHTFGLDKETPQFGTYFIKTGSFSNKFEFRNCACTEPDEMGQYFHLISNQAMILGAGNDIDLVVRDFIPAASHTPTIYHGMPLRCEMRAFIDLESKKLLGIVPYWHENVMKTALALAHQSPEVVNIDRKDLGTYMNRAPWLKQEFNRHRDTVAKEINNLITAIEGACITDIEGHTSTLHGAWSIDIMVGNTPGLDEGQLWLIDAAPMNTSALADMLLVTDEYSFVSTEEVKQLMQRPHFVNAEIPHFIKPNRIKEFEALGNGYKITPQPTQIEQETS